MPRAQEFSNADAQQRALTYFIRFSDILLVNFDNKNHFCSCKNLIHLKEMQIHKNSKMTFLNNHISYLYFLSHFIFVINNLIKLSYNLLYAVEIISSKRTTVVVFRMDVKPHLNFQTT